MCAIISLNSADYYYLSTAWASGTPVVPICLLYELTDELTNQLTNHFNHLNHLNYLNYLNYLILAILLRYVMHYAQIVGMGTSALRGPNLSRLSWTPVTRLVPPNRHFLPHPRGGHPGRPYSLLYATSYHNRKPLDHFRKYSSFSNHFFETGFKIFVFFRSFSKIFIFFASFFFETGFKIFIFFRPFLKIFIFFQPFILKPVSKYSSFSNHFFETGYSSFSNLLFSNRFQNILLFPTIFENIHLFPTFFFETSFKIFIFF